MKRWRGASLCEALIALSLLLIVSLGSVKALVSLAQYARYVHQRAEVAMRLEEISGFLRKKPSAELFSKKISELRMDFNKNYAAELTVQCAHRRYEVTITWPAYHQTVSFEVRP